MITTLESNIDLHDDWGFDVGLQIFKRFKQHLNKLFNLGVNYSLSSDIYRQ